MLRWRRQCTTGIRVVPVTRGGHGTLQKARSCQSQQECSAEKHGGLASSEIFDLIDERARVVFA
jgi:hypothetical protein